MSAKSAHLTLRPDRCNECGKCVAACPNDAVRVGSDYILIDWHACNQCGACVEVCAPSAIQRALSPARSAVAAPALLFPGDVSKVVVGSRAEAKAVRKAADKAAKQATRGRAKLASVPAVARPAVVPAVTGAGARAATATSATALTPAAQPLSAASAGALAASAAGATPARAAAESTPVPSAASRAWASIGAAWTWADAAILLAVLLVTIAAKIAILAMPAVALMPAAGRALARAVVLALYYGVQIGAIVMLAGRHGRGVLEAFGMKSSAAETGSADRERLPVGVTVLMTVGMLVGVEVIAIAYGLIAQAAGWQQPVTLSADVSTVFGGGGAGLIVSVLLVAIIAPIAEELAFRGVILRAIGSRWGQWPAIITSAALFAAYHINLWLFVPMFALGAALGWLAVERRSLWPAIALHVLYNSVAVAAAFIVPR